MTLILTSGGARNSLRGGNSPVRADGADSAERTTEGRREAKDKMYETMI